MKFRISEEAKQFLIRLYVAVSVVFTTEITMIGSYEMLLNSLGAPIEVKILSEVPLGIIAFIVGIAILGYSLD